MNIDLYVPSGIGDIYWILTKLIPTGHTFNIHTPPGLSELHKRSKFLEYLPGVISCKPDGIPYFDLVRVAKQYNPIQQKMFIEINTWLEAGKRLLDFMPHLPIQYKLNWTVSDEHKLKAESFLHKDKKNIVIYTSGFRNNSSQFNRLIPPEWSIKNWSRIFKMLEHDFKYNLIWIGASYDADILNHINPDASVHKLIDESAPVIIHLLRSCDKFISYQSGLSCISVLESIPTFMLYFKKIDALRFTFCPESSLNNPLIYSAEFFEPKIHEKIHGWINSNSLAVAV